MEREIHTAEEIRDEVSRRLNAGLRMPLEVPLPIPAARDPRHGNANWTMPPFRTATGKQIEIGMTLLAVKMRWDLAE